MPMTLEVLERYLAALRAAKVEQFELNDQFKVSFFSEDLSEDAGEAQPAVGFMTDQNVVLDEDE